MRTTTAAWFLPVSLAAVLAAVTNLSGLAYQAPGSPAADGAQAPGPPRAEADASVPRTGGPSQPSDVAMPRPAAPARTPPPALSGQVQQVYSTAWPYLDLTPTGRSYGGTGSTAANLPLSPTGRAGANRYPTPLGPRGGGGPLTPQAAAGLISGSRPSPRTSASSKPFSDYSRRPSVSPYLNLFRNDNDFGGIDNYNTLVKPMLQQRQVNRQGEWDVRSLQSRSGSQGAELRKLNQRTDILQGTYQADRFKNYFDYYPRLEP